MDYTRVRGLNMPIPEETKGTKSIEYCHCGRMLIRKWGNNLMCNIHKFEYFMPNDLKERKRIGRYSGRSRRFKGGYENY